MIKIENAEVTGWEHAIRGMRNPLNSWEKSDSGYVEENCAECLHKEEYSVCKHNFLYNCLDYKVGKNDLDLMKRLAKAGTDHRKYLRMITVYATVTGPLYWWKEFDTYKVGTVANSCSTMHKIHAKKFTLDDFSCEHLKMHSLAKLKTTVYELEWLRENYNNWDALPEYAKEAEGWKEKKDVWWQMIQLLPSSYNQTRNIMLNYEVLSNIYNARRYHKLDEWRDFCKWIETLPYSELITGGERTGSNKGSEN